MDNLNNNFNNNFSNKAPKYDLIIVGGGTSGCAASYIASVLNIKTLLIEKNNFLGGLMTSGLVVPVMKSAVDELNTDYYKKLVETAKKYNAQITYKDGNDGWFNPELLKIVLDDILTSPEINKNLDVLFEAEVKKVNIIDNTIKSLEISSGGLSIPIEAIHFIDATGNGSFSKLLNCNFLKDNKIVQQNSLRFILGNVDVEKFKNFLDELNDDEDITNTYRSERNTRNELHFTTASTWDTNKIWKLDYYLKKGVKEGNLLDCDRAYFQIFSVAGARGEVAFNCPRINNFKNNPYMASIELINARKAIYRLYSFVKKYFKGFEEAIIVNIASQTGVREECRLKTKYIYSKDDIISAKTFKKPVLRANYSIDIHSNKKNSSVLQKVSTYELPVEALISADYNNLYAVGKLVGADFEAHSALRVQKSCMSMAEGVVKYIKTLL